MPAKWVKSRYGGITIKTFPYGPEDCGARQIENDRNGTVDVKRSIQPIMTTQRDGPSRQEDDPPAWAEIAARLPRCRGQQETHDGPENLGMDRWPTRRVDGLDGTATLWVLFSRWSR